MSKKTRIILGIFLVLGGLGGMQSNSVAGILILGFGIFLLVKKEPFKKRPKKTPISAPTPTPASNLRQTKQTFTFNVAGISKENRQGIIKSAIKDWIESGMGDAYEGMTNTEIKEAQRDVYEADMEDEFDIWLTPEPNNKHDPNAIKVDSDNGMLGYVPAENTGIVKAIIKKEYDLYWRLVGGKYKYYDSDEDKVRTKTLTYGIEITLEYL